jgi:ornithine cyclodeaminase
MLILNSAAVSRALDHAACIEVLDTVMRQVSAGNMDMPLRRYLSIPGTQGKFTLMPGYLGEPRTFGVKIVSKYPREPGSRYGSHVGAVMVFDADEGFPLALLDGAELTAIRTSAASGLATRVLARADARVMAVLGTGDEARHHVAALLAARPFNELRLWGRTAANAAALAERLRREHELAVTVCESAQSAVQGADVVTTVTAATSPILKGEWLAPGSHVNLVGAAVRTAAEADQAVVTCGRFFVDYRTSAMDQAGELLDAIEAGAFSEAQLAGEIGEVLAGQREGRRNAEEITVYKSVGVAAQDLGAGLACWERARAQKIGVEVDW